MLIVCLAIILGGCLLPWGCWGDIAHSCDAGIIISFQYGFRFENNGGIFVLFLSLLVVGMVYFEPYFLKRSTLWAFICAVILFIYTSINIRYWILRGIEESGITGAATLEIGLGLILIGSIALLGLTIYRFRAMRF
jgi:hypothetical protein